MSGIARTLPYRFARATELYRAGKLRDAEVLCMAIVKTVAHFGSLYLLANIQFRLGRPSEALAHYEAALALEPEHPPNSRREAEHRGIAADRLIFAPRVPYREYLANYQLADLFLDTLPFNDCTTTSDALWSGLPLVTVSGDTFVSRTAGSLLRGFGLPELVTSSLADYKALARRRAQEPGFLAAVREKLRRDKTPSGVFDAERFCRHLEAAYEGMWERQHRGEPPAGFAVEPQR
jgi:predicted O-linked N-acetylglucosamine transferase (SPINDLY family)